MYQSEFKHIEFLVLQLMDNYYHYYYYYIIVMVVGIHSAVGHPLLVLCVCV